MYKTSLFIFFIAICTFSAAKDYKLCATSEYEKMCKWIESRDGITCVSVTDSVDCLLKMQKKEADFGTFFAEEAFLAAKFLGDAAVVLAEIRHPDREEKKFNFETVAVVRSNLFGGLSALKNLTYCHPGFSKAQYWSDRVLKAFEKKVMEHFKNDIICSPAARSAYEDDLYRLSMIFNKACRPGIWAASDWWDKKLKREYHSLCDQCEHSNTCSYNAQNKGKHSDALNCLTLHGGNVTYTALEYVQKYFALDDEDSIISPGYINPMQYYYLCQDGSTRPLTSSDSCSWIKQPWTAVIALSDSSQKEMLETLKQWLLEDENNEAWVKNIKEILTKGNGVLKFRDSLTSVTNYIKSGRSIPELEKESCTRTIKWCTVNEKEKTKCEYVSWAALTHGLPTQISCIQGKNKIDCLKKIQSREADVVYVDSELGYIARKIYNLTAAAFLETQKRANYYGVVVVKGTSIEKFKNLQGKRACFPQYNGLGWMTFVESLKTLNIIPKRSCSNSKKVWNYFSKACAPGATDSTINIQWNQAPEKLCKGCTSATKDSSCEANPNNPYFGEIGALNCLNDNNGDVAFLDFYAVKNYLMSSKKSETVANINIEDFKIICRDGSIETFKTTNPEKCSFTQINGGEVVMRNDLDDVRKSDIYLTLTELDDLFGTTSRHYNPALKIFEPFDGEENVLFKESAVALSNVFQTQNTFVNNYVKLLNSLENCMGENGTPHIVPSILVLIFSLVVSFCQS